MLKRITKAVTSEVRKALSTAPSDRKKLQKRRDDVVKELANLVAAIENGIALPNAKAEFQRLNMRFTVTPIKDARKPFLQVEGTSDLDALCGIRNLPSTTRSKAQTTPFPPYI